MKAMILAAGLGTRLAPFTDHHPKALAPVGSQTLLERNVRYLQTAGIYDLVVNVHHFADQIEAAIETGGGWGSSITISDERDEVLETGGGLQKAAPLFAGEASVLVMNVDVLTDLSLPAFVQAHGKAGGDALLAVMQRPSSRYLLFNDGMELCGWRNEKTGETRGGSGKDYAFTGIQIVAQKLLGSITRNGKFSLIDVYLDAVAGGRPICGYDHTGGLFMDAGKPESLARAAKLFV